MTFYCECGDCLADEVRLSPDEHEQIRTREDLVFAPGHDAPRRYRQPVRPTSRTTYSAEWRDLLTTSLIRASARV
jgi:hypothetical protein